MRSRGSGSAVEPTWYLFRYAELRILAGSKWVFSSTFNGGEYHSRPVQAQSNKPAEFRSTLPSSAIVNSASVSVSTFPLTTVVSEPAS